jgi:signal transduction histidine kinase
MSMLGGNDPDLHRATTMGISLFAGEAEGRLEQVLGNLLTNAVKYSDPNSEVRVDVAQNDQDVQVTVTNEGPGIAEDDLPLLFGRFYRTAAARRGGATGLGLGLFISRELIQAHGGRMWAESTPGQTTTFYFTLPIAADA